MFNTRQMLEAEESGSGFVQGMQYGTAATIPDSSTKGLNLYLGKLLQNTVFVFVCTLSQAEAGLSLAQF